ncbi:SET domain-containing protein-lysine N-methyltransferase [Pantoea sp. B65]|uniref:SET domain-containing protein-lysine N-methyltransferase n=1 Tax=Pantoea sp. B65 TaxID=2813359 RepID=UPI0039B5C1B6
MERTNNIVSSAITSCDNLRRYSSHSKTLPQLTRITNSRLPAINIPPAAEQPVVRSLPPLTAQGARSAPERTTIHRDIGLPLRPQPEPALPPAFTAVLPVSESLCQRRSASGNPATERKLHQLARDNLSLQNHKIPLSQQIAQKIHAAISPCATKESEASEAKKKKSAGPETCAGGLSAQAQKWLTQHAVAKTARGKIQALKVAQLFIANEEQLGKLGITRNLLADHYHLKRLTLSTIIGSLKRTPLPLEKLSVQAQNWLEKNPVSASKADKVTVRDVAKFYYDKAAELADYNITYAHLAAANQIKTTTLNKRINELKPGQKSIARKLSVAAEKWLSKHQLEKIKNGKVKISMLASFYLDNYRKIKQFKITLSALADLYDITPGSLSTRIRYIKESREGGTREITDEIIEKLQKYTIPADKDGKIPLESIAKFYLDNKTELKKNHITRDDLAIYHQQTPCALNAKINKINTAYARHDLKLNAQAQTWLKRTSLKKTPDTQVTAREVAEYYLEHKTEIQRLSISKSGLALWYGFRPEYLSRNISELMIKSGDLKLTVAAEIWLAGHTLETDRHGVVAANSVAEFYRRNEAQIKKLHITLASLAVYYDVNYTTMTHKIFFSKDAATQKQPPAEVTVKQEADADHDVRPWYPPEIRAFQRLPVLIAREDEHIALGYEQGPLRELLAGVHAGTLSFHPLPSDLKLTPAQRKKATQQLRQHVCAAQNGTLQQLIQQEGYFFLQVDFQYPQLGTGLVAKIALEKGTMVGLYAGVVYHNKQEFTDAARQADSNFPMYSFQLQALRARRKQGQQRKKSLQVNAAIGGQLRNGYMAYINTAEIGTDGRVLPSAKNNITAVKAGKNIIAFIANRHIAAGEELLTDYGQYYYVGIHRPLRVKPEPADMLPLDEYPPLVWLIDNIDRAESWTAPAFEIMPRLMAQSTLFRQKNACLVITDRDNIIIRVIDSTSGEITEPTVALQSTRPLAVIQNNGRNHYHCWLPAGGNVSFALMPDGKSFQVISGGDNYFQAIPRSGFCMTEAAATALLAREAAPPSAALIRQYGQWLRSGIKNFIWQASADLRTQLVNLIPPT